MAQPEPGAQAADFVLSNGMAVTRDVAPAVEAGKTLTRLQYGAHYALLDPAAFADLPLGPGTRVAVADVNGHVLGCHRVEVGGIEPPSKALLALECATFVAYTNIHEWSRVRRRFHLLLRSRVIQHEMAT
ncbi:hypothetical protein [Herbaspirillum sp. SJZ099]|uniref:hypothetical protein n=1 Tax=Herbaspirillum sp. SJZ099 TaxID=2572916 RepID=UPI0011A5DE49|nr:hypothetical protein [Herbaspirillum sp. SJZ099]TWC72001.1 hypothetical protein FB597_101986 [Herbaspirillum sp. SJZ099]